MIKIDLKSKNFRKAVILIVFLLFILLIAYFFPSNSVKNFSISDQQNVTESYLTDLNDRLNKYGVNEKITKEDFNILDKTISEGLLNTSNLNSMFTKQGKDNGGMEGFTPREQMLFLPQISTIRKLCKQDKEYCNTYLGE